MNKKPSEIEALIELEIQKIADPLVLAHLRKLRVVPYMTSRVWEYGEPGQAFPCWIVLEHPSSNTGICFCESGFGPRHPWGLVGLNGSPAEMSMGADSAWFSSFKEAFFDSFAVTELPIWRVYRSQKELNDQGHPLTEEGEWDATCLEVYRLRELHKNYWFHCRTNRFGHS